jgi:hypothetical protein
MSFISKVSVADSPAVGVSAPNAPTFWQSPVREYRTIVNDSDDPGYTNRLLVGTAVTLTGQMRVRARPGGGHDQARAGSDRDLGTRDRLPVRPGD